VEQDLFRLNVGRFRELLEAKLSEQDVRIVECILAECQTQHADDDPFGMVELRGQVAQLGHEVSQPLTAISNYLSACRHLTSSGDRQQVQTGLRRMADQVDRAWEVIWRLRELVN
jgi:phosphoglycerate-specific signal transduction histidine kinase